MTPLLTCREAAVYLSVTIATLRRWRRNGTGPEYIRLPSPKPGMGHVRYVQADIDAWMQEREVTP